METLNGRCRIGLFAAAGVVAANIGVPLWLGDVYPFTSAPMFREPASQFCNYRVFATNGQELAASDWLLQRVYDGNPVGYGLGVRPPPVLEQQFGIVQDEQTVREHVERQFEAEKNRPHDAVEVEQQVVGPTSDGRIGVVATNRWQISRAAP